MIKILVIKAVLGEIIISNYGCEYITGLGYTYFWLVASETEDLSFASESNYYMNLLSFYKH